MRHFTRSCLIDGGPGAAREARGLIRGPVMASSISGCLPQLPHSGTVVPLLVLLQLADLGPLTSCGL